MLATVSASWYLALSAVLFALGAVGVMVGVDVAASVLVKRHSRNAPGWRTASTLSSPGSKAAVLFMLAPRRL